MEVLSKSEFAAHIKVSPGRVSQYISAGIIGADAMVGEGRSARIHVGRAIEQIRARRHIGQAMGNGLLTDLREAPLVGPDTPSPEHGELSRKPADPAELIQIERLESERRKNRMAAVDEARRLGTLVEAEAVQREVGKAAQATVNVFTGMAPDLANAIAAKFEVPQRDVLHLIRQVMNEKRAALATQLKTDAAALPQTREIVIE